MIPQDLIMSLLSLRLTLLGVSEIPEEGPPYQVVQDLLLLLEEVPEIPEEFFRGPHKNKALQVNSDIPTMISKKEAATITPKPTQLRGERGQDRDQQDKGLIIPQDQGVSEIPEEGPPYQVAQDLDLLVEDLEHLLEEVPEIPEEFFRGPHKNKAMQVNSDIRSTSLDTLL